MFLHGMGGNIKACLWVLSKLSSRTKCAVIAPTFGFGNWDRPDAAEFVVDVAHEALATLPLDPERVFLMGYSNGAHGRHAGSRQRAAALQRAHLPLAGHRGRVLLHARVLAAGPATARFFSCKAAATSGFRGAWSRGPSRLLKRLGCDVRLKVYDEEDHYLLFSQQESVLGEIEKSMAARPLSVTVHGPESSRHTPCAVRRLEGGCGAVSHGTRSVPTT